MESNYNMIIEDKTVKITLSGNLDAKNAPSLSEELKKLIGQDINKIIFIANDLEYISSAGLRVIIFSKQKLGDDVTLEMVGAQEAILEVIEMSGLDNIMDFK